MKITRIDASNDCGGFRPPKGHMDTQMFPECEGTETDRDIVKKTVEERKRKKRKKKKADQEISMKTVAKKKKKKEWNPNPWAVCTESIGKTEGTTERSEWDEDAKDRYERCVLEVKKDQKSKKKKSFNLKKYKIASKNAVSLEKAIEILQKKFPNIKGIRPGGDWGASELSI